MGLKNHLQGFILGIFLFVSCGSVSYRYYGLEVPLGCYDQGKLYGPTPDDDKPFTLCKPEPGNANKCIVMETSELESAKTELKQLRQKLKDCQAGSSP